MDNLNKFEYLEWVKNSLNKRYTDEEGGEYYVNFNAGSVGGEKGHFEVIGVDKYNIYTCIKAFKDQEAPVEDAILYLDEYANLHGLKLVK